MNSNFTSNDIATWLGSLATLFSLLWMIFTYIRKNKKKKYDHPTIKGDKKTVKANEVTASEHGTAAGGDITINNNHNYLPACILLSGLLTILLNESHLLNKETNGDKTPLRANSIAPSAPQTSPLQEPIKSSEAKKPRKSLITASLGENLSLCGMSYSLRETTLSPSSYALFEKNKLPSEAKSIHLNLGRQESVNNGCSISLVSIKPVTYQKAPLITLEESVSE